MEKNTVERVERDIQLIKEVIENTSKSISELSKTFILLGFLLLGASLINSLSHLLAAIIPGTLFLGLGLGFVLLIIAGMFFIFYKAYKTPMMGVGKQLVRIWICIIIFQIVSGILDNSILPNLFNMHSPDNWHVSKSLQFLAYAVGFLCMGVFTDFKISNLLALLYVIIGLFYILPNPLTSMNFLNTNPSYFRLTEIIDYGVSLLIPITFLLIGYYLKNKKFRVNNREFQLNS
ncbi:MAG: hypothetical protein P4L59_18225 [Desulfosporosinus sp.]|nr:hypothetical protein [Desulfosporosinus sp.]